MNMAYSLLMSTATIALNEEGNAYTPRKQGAGLANLKMRLILMDILVLMVMISQKLN